MIGASFTCNICGAASVFEPVGDWRESPSCGRCGSSVRMRSMVHCLLEGLFGQSKGLRGLKRHGVITGVGLSDWEGYATPLSRAFAYINSFYHREPRLDICAPGAAYLGHCDFLTSSDVFEHVPPPASQAFDGAFAMLRPGGLLVLTVPYSWEPDTVEHYADLRSYEVEQAGGDYVVIAKDAQGRVTRHADPVFHGGPGSTLEMRVFSLPDVVAELTAAGFIDIVVHEETVPEWGIFPPHRYGLPITARKPATTSDQAKAVVRRTRSHVADFWARVRRGLSLSDGRQTR